jgi:hypothetical protein
MQKKCGIFILTQNNIERKVYLKTSLYFLFRNFNAKYKYPIIILHEGDYDITSQNEIINSIREEGRHLVSFKKIDEDDFKIPDYINEELLDKCINLAPVPYWRNKNYRKMCNFWINHFFKYVTDYDYVMRLDDDSIIEEAINNDLFKVMEERSLIYISNLVHIDCGLCCYGMKELFEKILPDKKEDLKQLFTESKIPMTDINFIRFNEVYKLVEGKSYENANNEFIINMPIMYYNNFFVTDVSFWNRYDVKDIITKINNDGKIFYYRHGDAPIQTIIVTLLEPQKISRTIFKYSKKLQRECFVDNNKNIHIYMPKTYAHNSCITYKD